ncbi:PA3715 family protein [Frigoriflavimonas asaccharolytica]|uniref:Secreted protein n=1 Tax=Frigoriflavimonas asaccharolytica TaxID=2735899 RepID=A0A8J8G5E8_9FLAO|nr:hypothetical protein [Frigoriflavimonas asaccharolytica]NRS91584.1 hypothetical protein [Frigoriflavimonas asaccharolytica]
MTKNIILIILLALFSPVISAQENLSPIASKILKELKIPESAIQLQLYSEKQMPNSPDNSIYILPKYSEDGKENFDENYFDIDVNIIIANNTTGKIVAKYQVLNAYTSDAVRLDNIVIDTGLYNLNEKTRAFGIRVNFIGMSRPNPYDITLFSLFMIKNNQLVKVLDDFELDKSNGEWDTNCAGDFVDSIGLIDLTKEKSKDLKNIKVKFNITKTHNFLKNGDCDFAETKSTKTKILKFNGKEYK